MSKAPRVAALALALWSLPAVAQTVTASVPPALATGVVRGYFDALRRQDRRTLSGVTEGNAAAYTTQMLDRISDEAQRQDVGVELKVRNLVMYAAPPSEAATPVDVRFDIAVVAKKWFFHKVARVLKGHATFFVGKNVAPGEAPGAKIVNLRFAFE